MIDWVREEPQTLEDYAWAILTAFIAYLLVIVGFQILVGTGILTPVFPLMPGKAVAQYDPFTTIVLAPIREEILYRAIPLWLAVRFTRDESLILGVVVASSLAFGIGHPLGAASIALQGIGGLISCALYLKCGGLRGAFLAPFSCVVIEHMAGNAFLVLISRL
jgi:hypothetical protein